MNYSIFSIQGLLRFCFRFKFIISAACFSYNYFINYCIVFLPVKYKSIAVISPATTNSITQALLIEDNPYKKDILIGEDESVEGLMQILTSDFARDLVIDQFNLYENYEISRENPYAKTWVNLEYQENFIFKKNNLGSIKITVFDEDPFKASEMAHSFIGISMPSIIDSIYNKVRYNRAMDNISICEFRQEMLTKKLNNVNDSLNDLRENYGIIYPERQIERLTEQKAIALRMNNLAGAKKIQKELDVFNSHVTKHDFYKVQSLEIQEELHRIEDVVDLALIELNYPFQNYFIIDRAVQLKKNQNPFDGYLF